MLITYLYHSGFAVELEKHILLFDYYTGEESNHTKQTWTLPEWNRDKQVCVFISHKHHDHFDMSVFQLAERYPDIHFFLGCDIKLSARYLERCGVPAAILEKLTNIGKNKRLVYDGVTIETLRSTDVGVAFIVQTEGKCFYHAGDLNWWHWEGESAAYHKNMEREYCGEIDTLAGRHITAAFVPLDPRLGEAYRYGLDYFLAQADADYVFPMHMWEHYDLIGTYKQSWQEGQNRFGIDRKRIDTVMDISHAYEQFELGE